MHVLSDPLPAQARVDAASRPIRRLTVGLGFRRGVTPDQLDAAIRVALGPDGMDEIACVATLQAKAHEPALLAFCERHQISLVACSVEEINACFVENPSLARSPAARQRYGVEGVCEPCALLAMPGVRLLRGKQALDGVTVAIGTLDAAQEIVPSCPALFISAPASGQGKTTVTAGLALLHRQRGRRVRVFKAGPDFLDPMILARASGAPVQSLDLRMVGERECRRLLAEAAEQADLILIEGVMGLFDGTPSSADLAAMLGVPIVAVISAGLMAQTFGAVAFGLAHYRPDVSIHGVLANHVSSARHVAMLRDGMPAGLRWLGHLAPSEAMALPARHLGLHQAEEIDGLESRIALTAEALADTALAELPAPVFFHRPAPQEQPRLLDGMHIGIARDAAFSFIYPANVSLLESLGARIGFFSPLANETLPDNVDALFLPGGYPELHAATLSGNSISAESIRAHALAGKPIVAECGGMLYLLDEMTDIEGISTPMLGLLPGRATMQKRLSSLGMQVLDTRHGRLTGHTFHYSSMTTPLAPECHATRLQTGAVGEPVFRSGAIVASYMHGYWPSNPVLAAALFRGQAF